MTSEIDIKIIVNNDTLTIADMKVSVSVSAPMTFEAMDFIMYDTFTQLVNKFQERIQKNNSKIQN